MGILSTESVEPTPLLYVVHPHSAKYFDTQQTSEAGIERVLQAHTTMGSTRNLIIEPHVGTIFPSLAQKNLIILEIVYITLIGLLPKIYRIGMALQLL